MKKFIIISVLTLTVSMSLAMSKKVLNKVRSPATAAHDSKYPYLDFIELKQFTGIPKDKFDLSGLAIDKSGTVYTISDKERHNHIYKLDWKAGTLSEFMDFGIEDKLDIEAIDICDDTFYLSNEKNDAFYILKKGEKTQKISFDLKKYGVQKYFFSGNQGFEGMAIDCENQIMYAAKERQPRFLLTIDLKAKKILKQWNIPETDALDYSDAKYENGYLYLLERSGMDIAKVDVQTGQVVAKYSYQNLEKGYGYLFGPSLYSFAEALMLTPTEIWIGFDNNGLKVTNQSHQDLDIKGKRPLVMRFKRPTGF